MSYYRYKDLTAVDIEENQRAVARKQYRPKPDVPYYETHDNGGRPFLVERYPTKLVVYIQMAIHVGLPPNYTAETILKSESCPLFIQNVKKVWTGEKDSSILVQLKDASYVFIGDRVFTFELPDDSIIRYFAPIGNSDVVYPFAVGRDNTYLLMDTSGGRRKKQGLDVITYIPNDDLQGVDDPYNYFWFQLSKNEQKKYTNTYVQVIEILPRQF